jgi:hypothetical protein
MQLLELFCSGCGFEPRVQMQGCVSAATKAMLWMTQVKDKCVCHAIQSVLDPGNCCCCLTEFCRSQRHQHVHDHHPHSGEGDAGTVWL